VPPRAPPPLITISPQGTGTPAPLLGPNTAAARAGCERHAGRPMRRMRARAGLKSTRGSYGRPREKLEPARGPA
jgi:hypothetical protein